MSDTTKLINEALNDLEEEKTEIERRITLVKSIDWTKPVTEDEWHELCDTPIRHSDLLNILVKNIFPNAENIKRGCNYMFFELYGYKVQIPTSRERGINIATDWYKDIAYFRSVRSPMHTKNMEDVMAYFDAVDNKHGWKTQAKYRLYNSANMSTFELFIKWFGKYKWKKVDRKKLEARWAEEERRYNEKTEKFDREEREMKEKLNFVANTLIPELEKFSQGHYRYYDGSYHTSIQDILKQEYLI